MTVALKLVLTSVTKIVLFVIIMSASFIIRGDELYFKKINFATTDTEENGNPTVNAIFKDSKGFVWIGSDKYLARFDGLRVLDTPLIDGENPVGNVTAFSEFSDMCVLIGTQKGLYRYPDKNYNFSLEQLFSTEIGKVSALLQLDDNQILVGTDKGVKLITRSGAIKEYPITSNLLSESNNVLGMSRLKDDVYIITRGGLYKLNLPTFKYSLVANAGYADVEPTSIVATPEKIYIGTMGRGVVPYNLKTGKREPMLPIAATVVTAMVADTDYSNLYVATDGSGVFKLSLPSEGVVAHYNHQPNNYYSLHNNQVRSLMLDDNKLLWIGYYQNGIDYTLNNFGAFSVFNDPKYLNSRGVAVRAMVAGESDIALGTREGLIYIDFIRQQSYRLNSSKLRSDMVLSLLRVGDKLYVGTYGGGLSVVNLKDMSVTGIRSEATDGTRGSATAGSSNITFTNGHVFAIERKSDNSIWIGTNTGVYQIVDDKVVKHFTSNNSKLPEGNVYEIFFDSQNKGWVCTESGVCIYDPNKNLLRTDVFPEDFPKTKRVHTIFEDSKHQLYFLPEKGSSFRTTLDMKDLELLDPVKWAGADVKAIIEDKTGAIWLTTARGVFRYSEGHWHHYSFADGVPSQVFLQCQPGLDHEGNPLFGNSDGLLRCDLSKLEASDKCLHKLNIVGIKASGKELPIIPMKDKVIELDEYYSSLLIEFSTFSYSIDDARDYEYSVDGGEWMPFNDDFTITMDNVGGGKHRLIVRNIDNTSTEVTIDLDMPYSWLTKILFFLGVFTLCLLVYIVWFHFFVRRRARIRREAEAARIAAEEAKEMSAEEPVVKKKYSANHISDEKCAEIVKSIESVMISEKPFLNQDMKIADLAALTNVSSHKLSYIFSQYMNVSFYDYINRLRVEEFKQVVARQGADSLTLAALAEKAGFSSRASFFRYFKEIEGISPGEYIKNLPK